MNILVVELNRYHTEVFPVYEEYLGSLFPNTKQSYYYTVHPTKFEELKTRFKNLSQITNKLGFFLIFHLQLRRVYLYLKLQSIIKKKSIDVVVFNSIEPKRYYKIFKKLKVEKKIGIVHNYGEIDIVKDNNEKYFVLADYAYKNLVKKDAKVDGYLCAFLPNIVFTHTPPKKDFVTIAISGHIDFGKRDFPFLIEICKTLEKKEIKNIKFNIVSSVAGAGEGEKLTNLVKESSLDDYFIFHEYLNDDEFFKNIYESDFIMPLVNIENSQFIYERLTSPYIMATSYKKPMIMEEAVADGWEIDKDASLIYHDLGSIVEVLSNLKDCELSVLEDKFDRYVKDKIETNKEFLKSITFD